MKFLAPSWLGAFATTGPTDPIRYYRAPLVGHLFRERINAGLRLLQATPPSGRVGARFGRALEIGYGAGAVLAAIADDCSALCGVDLDADPAVAAAALRAHGVSADLARGSVLDLPYDAASFDLVLCFSVFEHLRDYRRALAESSRVLAPGGLFLIGMPSVNRAMELAFRAIGFRGIEDHHVTTPLDVETALRDLPLCPLAKSGLDVPCARPLGARVYHHFLLQRPTLGAGP